MAGNNDLKDSIESRKLGLFLIGALAIMALAIALMLPLLSDFIATHFTPGLGLKDSAIISFFVTIVVMVVFAIASGDGLLGELQFILAGFFSFFLIFWLMLAWIF